MIGFPLSKKVSQMIRSLTSMLAVITVSWMLKATHMELLTYIALKAPLKMTISMNYMIYQSNKYTDT